MSAAINHWKLGLFVVVALTAAITAGIVLGVQTWNMKTIAFVTYFDESVQGLDVGSPVKYRGVTVGRVAAIEIAPDLRHVKVVSELSADRLGTLNLTKGEGQEDGGPGLFNRRGLRVQIAQSGITGVKFLLLDFVEPELNPVEPLPFDVPGNYIPSTPSTLKTLQDSVEVAADRLPQIINSTARAMDQMESATEQVVASDLPGRAKETLDEADVALNELTVQLRNLNARKLSMMTQESLEKLDGMLERGDAMLKRLDGDKGLIRNTERGVLAIGEVAQGARTVGPELQLTLREVRGAARAVKRLADALERDSDMLLKGRADYD